MKPGRPGDCVDYDKAVQLLREYHHRQERHEKADRRRKQRLFVGRRKADVDAACAAPDKNWQSGSSSGQT